ncbi:MAG: FimB/Mfa2 family fimbrial subunit, partial [Prevotella sp.]|nr:FimB/Mfa2 family fimbrial subunit [Prevotella sp.]
MKKSILSIILLASGLLSGCSSEESVSRPETIGQTGTLTFSFPSPRRSVTYAEDDSDPLAATENEAAINDVTVYMFQSSGELLLVARKSASPTEVDARSVTFDVNNFKSTNSGYTFYAVANVSGNITDNFVVGSTTLDGFTSAVATSTDTSPIQGSNMLMVGYTTIPDLSAITESAYTITLRHRVARFDIYNVTEDDDQTNNNDQAGDETFFEITRIHVTNTFSAGYLTEESNDQNRPDPAAKVSLRGLDAIDVSGVTGINEGLAKGAFYLWPGSLDKKENLTDASTLVEVEGVYTGDGKPVVYKVLLANDQPVVANKRYILKVSRIDRTNLVFELEVSDWDDGETITAVPSVDAVEYIDFSLNSTVLPDGEDIDIDLSDNTGDSELRFSTLSENRATGDLTATLDLTVGTGYYTVANDLTPVAEGDPVVTYAGAKVRQTYKIILPKTTYPVKGTLTIKEEATTKTQTFNITSVPVYEDTEYRPVPVEGNYSGSEPVVNEVRYWAPVNVGATSTVYNVNSPSETCGYYFQWGRSYTQFGTYGSTGDTFGGPVTATDAETTYAGKFITNSS